MRRLFGRMLPLCLMAAALTMTGCGHTQTAVPPPAAVTPTAPAAPFQPYALVNQPPPKPKVATHRNEVLRLTHRAGQVYLADGEGHLYHCGRDHRGHVFPIYQDPATRLTYPLYYDRSRDRLYRLAQNDDGHYYRGYVGDPDNRFYRDDPDYERISPEGRDRPIVTDADNHYNYDDYGGYPSHHGYRVGEGTYYPAPYSPPSAHHNSHNNTNWLWAIPVIVVAYLLLNPHHHSSPPAPPQSTVIVQRHIPPTIINRTRNVTVIRTNNTTINRTNNVVINRPAPVRPVSAPRPIALVHPFAPRPHIAALVTPAPRPMHHSARPRPIPLPVHFRPAAGHRTAPPTFRPRPSGVPAPRYPLRLRRELVQHPRLIVRPRSAPAKPHLVATPHHVPLPVRARPVTVRRSLPARPRLVVRSHPAPHQTQSQVHHAVRPSFTPRPVRVHRPAVRREVTRPAPPVVHHPRPAAPSHPAPRPAPRPQAQRRSAPHPANHPRPAPQPKPGPKHGNGPAGKKK